MSGILFFIFSSCHPLNSIQALKMFHHLIILWDNFQAPYYKRLNDARVASTCFYVRTCQRVKNSRNIATIHDFQIYIRVNSLFYITHKIFLSFYIFQERKMLQFLFLKIPTQKIKYRYWKHVGLALA